MAGVAALADLNAARLLLIPIVIIGMAWIRVARPAMGQMIAESDDSKLRSFVWKSTLAMEGFTAVYVAGLFAAFPWLTQYVFGPKYRGISPLMLMWGCYFALNCARNVGTILLTSYGAFRALFWQGVLSLFILMVATLALTPPFGVMGALGAMIIVELWELLVNYAYMLPRARRQQLNVK
jgi:O-antigen/teichoic acid export membrane protein